MLQRVVEVEIHGHNMNPDEIVTITNNKTKQIKQVKRRELPTYGLPEDYSSQSDLYSKELEAGRIGADKVPEAYRAGALQSLKARGKTLQTPEDRVATRQKNERSRSYNVLEKDVSNFEKNFKEAGLRGKALGFLPSGTGLSPESSDFDAQRNLLAYSLAKGLGEQTGHGVSDADFKKFLTQLPSRTDTDQEAKLKIENIYQQLSHRKGGEPQKSSLNKDKRDTGNFFENAKRNQTEIIQGMVRLPEMVSQTVQNPGVMLPEIGKSIANEAGQFVNNPLGYSYENPMDVALTALPFARPVGGAAKAAGTSIKGGAAKLPKIGGGSKMAEDIGRNAFTSNFTIPSKLAPRIKIDNVADKMIEHGHRGSLDELGAVADRVTGAGGIFPKLNRDRKSVV